MDIKLVESYLESIAGSVVDEDKIVTYKSLSRNLNIHVNTAKQLLYLYLTNEKAKNAFPISATYLVAGKVIDGSFNISIVNESDLKTAHSNLVQVTSEHVYSVQKGKNIKDLKCLCGVDKDSVSNSSKLVIKHSKNVLKHNEEVKKKSHTDEEENKKIIQQALAPTVVQEKKVETVQNKKISPKGKAQKNTEKPKGNIAQMFAKVNQKNAEKSSKDAVREKPQSVSDRSEKIKEEVKIDNGTSKRRSKSKENLKRNVGNKRRRIQVLSDSEESEDDDEEQHIEIDEVETQQEEQQPPPSSLNLEEEMEETKELTSSNKRKKRKVIDKTVMSEDGYLETRKEVVFETDSEDEVKVETKPKVEKKQTVEKAKSAQNAKKQSSLLSFFKKS